MFRHLLVDRTARGLVATFACCVGCSSSEFSSGTADAGLTGAGGGAGSSNGGAHAAGGANATGGAISTAGGSGNGGGGVNAGGQNGGTNAGGVTGGGTTSTGGVVVGGTTGSGGGQAAGGAGGGHGGDTAWRPCLNPTPIHVSNGPQTSPGDTGYDMCNSTWVARRRVAMACPLGPTTTNANQCSPSYCSTDADCTAQPHGFCSEARHLAGYCGCFYGCMQDSDCDSGSICFCGTPVGHCVPATCKDDTSCAPGALCASYLAPCIPGALPSGGGCTGAVNGCFDGFACQNPSDECLYDSDCLPDNGRCELHGDKRVCAPVCPGPPPPAP